MQIQDVFRDRERCTSVRAGKPSNIEQPAQCRAKTGASAALGAVPKTPENPPPHVPQRPHLMSRPSNSRRGMNRPANARRLLVASGAPEFAGFRPRLFLTRTGDRFARKRYSSPHLFIQAAKLTMTDPEQGGNRRGAIAGLAIAVVLLVTGLWLAHELTAASKLQDCLMTGRTNCAVIPAQ
jgi:hypothetical protein